MALAKDIMGGGTSAGQAKAINGNVKSSVSAAGTTISDATQLNATKNFVSTVGSGEGVKLFNGEISDDQLVYNGGANALKVYPHSSSGIINQLSAGSAVTVPQYTTCHFARITSTRWVATLSA
jgi:hypothetical protein